MASILVGFDGTDAARAAVSVAAAEAELRGSRLLILHSVEAADIDTSRRGIPAGEADAGLMDQGVALARLMLPADRIDVETVHGWAVEELFSRSHGAQMLVLGRGHPSALGALLGSVALDAATGASCPVLVVPEPGSHAPSSGAVVVVGVHGVHDSTDALQEAFTEAHLRRAQLVAVHTVRYGAAFDGPERGPSGRDPLGLNRDPAAVLRKAVKPFRARFPLVAVTEQLSRGRPAPTLVELSSRAQLLVVGSRGRGPVKGLLLGSVGQHVVRQAGCPVLVARPRTASPDGTATTAQVIPTSA